MENKFKITDNTTSYILYHFVICPRYRRRIFKFDGVEKRFGEVVKQVCEKEGFELKSIECGYDYAHLVILCNDPFLSPAEIIRKIKVSSNTTIKEEFEELSKMPSVWTKNFLVSTKELDWSMIEYYVTRQQSRSKLQ